MAYYISRGRPRLYENLLYHYTPKNPISTVNPWLHIVDVALKANDEHVVKTVRSLMKADMEWSGGDHDLYLKAAILTVDNIGNANDWSFGGLGWDQEWTEQGKA